MKVNLNFFRRICEVTREEGDPVFSKSSYGSPEEMFLSCVKEELLKKGYDVVQEFMCKDGHLVDRSLQQVRSRDIDSKNFIMVYNNEYAIKDAGEAFDKDGFYNLTLVF
mgnify:CR=1 FL=1